MEVHCHSGVVSDAAVKLSQTAGGGIHMHHAAAEQHQSLEIGGTVGGMAQYISLIDAQRRQRCRRWGF